MGTDGRWTGVEVRVPHEQGELVADLLWRFGPAAVEERDGGGVATLLVAGFADPVAARSAARAVERAGLAPSGAVSVEPVVDDGADGWRGFARVERAGPFVLAPAWSAAPPVEPESIVLRLDPERTFGSGSHPTTRLVLATLPRLVRPGSAVLDVGAGSGVLAVAAAVLGAAPVDAIDVDPSSPDVVRANAGRNGVGDAVRPSTTSVAALVAAGRSYDVVLANLLAPVLRELARDLLALVRPGAHLVVSGLLADRWRRVLTHFDAATVVAVDEDDGWVAVTLGVPAPGEGTGSIP